MEKIIVGLDLGSYVMKAAAVCLTPDKNMDILGVYEIASQGICKGNIVDLAEASSAVEKLMVKIKEQHGDRIYKVVPSVGGSGFSSDRSMGSLVLHGNPKELTKRNIESVIQSARNMSYSLDRYILHEIVEGFILDGQGGVKNPIGLFAKKLEVKLYTLFHNLAHMQNVIRCINYAGYDVEKITFCGIAGVNCMVSDKELSDGLIFVDIGHETAKAVVSSDGKVKFSTLINMGGSDITRAIAMNFRIPFSSAERLKLESSIGDDIMTDSKIGISIGNINREISRKEINSIVRQKSDEILSSIKDSLEYSSIEDFVKSGIVMSGGGVLLEGLPERTQEFFNLPVRIVTLEGYNLNIKRPSHLFAPCIGALEEYTMEIREKAQIVTPKRPLSKITRKITTFLNDYF